MRKKNPAGIHAAAATIPFILTTTAYAQAPEQSSEPGEAVQEVTVTGSRIQRADGFSAPTPVTVVGADRLEQRAIANVGDALNELPSFRASTNPATVQNTGGNIGARVLDLRGLGASRTLVLVDGKRFVASTSQGTIDTNLIPSALIDRVDIVTGGASAAYGSDAVAGVVNFALAEEFEGLRANTSYGASFQGDDENMSASLAGGLSFSGGRGHFVWAGEFSNEHGLGDCYSRSWCGAEWLNLGNSPPGTDGRPANNITDDVHTATLSQDGVINSSSASFPLRGITFNPDGTTRPFQYGELYGTNLAPIFMKGGEGHGENVFISGYLLKTPVKRYIAYTKTTFDFTDSVTGGLDLSFGQVHGESNGVQYRDGAGNDSAQSFGPIRSGNPFIPASVQQIMTDNNIETFVLGRAFGDVGNARASSTTKTYRAVASLQGKFGDGSWGWDGYYQFGKNDVRLDVDGNVSISRMRNAIDAVTNASGEIVCRINADANPSNDDPACAPFNPFGRNRFSAEAREYVTPHGFQTTAIREHVAAANAQGDLFALPAGAVQLAGGVEWRKQKLEGDADPVSKATDFYSLNGQALSGQIEVTEGYLETNVPLLSERPFARSLELNGAVRRTHYSFSNPTTGDNSLSVTTWKVGTTWEVTPEVRLRATRSRDIRAPNLSELFGPQTTGGGGVIDPATGRQLNPQQISGSNPLLTPETADSWTAGVVLRPGGVLEGLQLAVDYYDIQVDDAIGTLGGQTVANRCHEGATEFCPLVDRDPVSGEIVRIRNLLLNVNSVITRGLDIEAQYRFTMGAAGTLDMRLLGTIVNDLITADSVGETQRAGMTGWRAGTQPGMPDWSVDLLTTWSRDRLSLTMRNKYIPSGQYNNSLVGPNEPGWRIDLRNGANINEVDSRFYTDLSGQFRIRDDDLVVYAAINNVFDQEPPLAPSVAGNGNFILFDPIGRSYRVGVRAQF